MREKQVQLAKYRLKQSEECIDEAEYLLKGKKSSRSIINRIYYSFFYAILSLLIFEQFSSSKHSGVISYFNKKFIKNKIFSKETGMYLNRIFELRQRADYREFFQIDYQEIKPFIEEAKNFLKLTKNYIEENYIKE